MLVLESFARDINKKCLISPTSEARMVAECVRKEFDNFGSIIDLSHIALLTMNPLLRSLC